jgi:hypothetical protein
VAQLPYKISSFGSRRNPARKLSCKASTSGDYHTDRYHELQQNKKRITADKLLGRISHPHWTIVNGMRSSSTRKPGFALSHHVELAKDVTSLQAAIKRAQAVLFNLQHHEGYWLGELEANSTLCSDYVAFMHWSGEIDSDLQKKCVKHLLAKQLADGGCEASGEN